MSKLNSLLVLLSTASLSNGAIVLSGNFITGSPTATLTITTDIPLNIIATGNIRTIVFDNWVTSDGTQSFASSFVPQAVAYELNGASATIFLTSLNDNWASPSGAVTADDGHIFTDGVPVTIGDSFVVKAGSYTFSPHGQFNPALNGAAFNGEVFLTDGSFARLSDNAAVPEPSTMMLGAIASIGLLRRRR